MSGEQLRNQQRCFRGHSTTTLSRATSTARLPLSSTGLQVHKNRNRSCLRHLLRTTKRVVGAAQFGTDRAAVVAMDKVAWQEVAVEQAARPSLPRSGACAAALPKQHDFDIIMFGGYTETADRQLGSEQRAATSDAWLFSVGADKWTSVKYAPGSGVPRVRLVAQAVVIENKLWVIGGWDPGFNQDGGEILNDIWALDLSTWEWWQVQPIGATMPKISRFQAVAIEKKIYIHTHRSMQDILVLDTAPSAPVLSFVPVAGGATPSSRGLHSMTAVGRQLYVFGGAPQSGPMLGDLWKLDVDSMAWHELHPSGDAPHARCSHAAAAVGSKIYMHGGSHYREAGGLHALDDLLVLDTLAMRWEPLEVQGSKPLPRNAACMCIVDKILVLHSGWKPFVETYNDTWLMPV